MLRWSRTRNTPPSARKVHESPGAGLGARFLRPER
ncbi:hypothetical protein SAMN05421869_114123 [Nonomuraea jiangxiensis]|uniref:Uncharacterized protein n=1 Tax=Nonomuraea jiangxiensis TaxID=633440 RepID=A0A1G8ZMP8_9ACTN|nr:hypothetical protein SAMN05421869_114123 [Nonomuraea jiangxiensis]